MLALQGLWGTLQDVTNEKAKNIYCLERPNVPISNALIKAVA